MFNSPRFTARPTASGPRAITLFSRMIRPALSMLGLCLAATVLAGLGGCSSSKDRHTYESTIYRPTSITIKDTVTDEFIWKMDIPVEHKLTLDFDSKGEKEWKSVDATLPATSMKWKLQTRRKEKVVDKGKFKMPAPHGTIVLMSLRPAPEEPVAVSGSFSPVISGGSDVEADTVESAPITGEESEPAAQVDPDSPAALYEPALADDPKPAVETESEAVEAVEVTPATAPAAEGGDPLLDALDLDK